MDDNIRMRAVMPSSAQSLYVVELIFRRFFLRLHHQYEKSLGQALSQDARISSDSLGWFI
jgi:hypothetical protein